MPNGPPDTRSHVVFFPYLPLRKPVEVGDWVLSPVSGFDGPWKSDQFEDLSHRFIAAFRAPNSEAISNPTLASRRDTGCDGAPISSNEQDALRRAVEFAVLDRNQARSDDVNLGSVNVTHALTTDNAEMHVWPIDLAEGRVAQQRGFVVPTLVGGYRIRNGLAIAAPQDLHLPFGDVTLDGEVATAVYRTVDGQPNNLELTVPRRVARVIGWLAKAWRNTPAISWEDRIVFLKTGFETLTRKSETDRAGKSLRHLFEQVSRGYSTDHLLWSPTESASRPYTDRSGKTRRVTDLEHWFRNFGEVRNDVIHGNAITEDLTYEESGSAYNGSMFNTAERLLREATKVELTRLGHDRLFCKPTTRAIGAYLENIESKRP